VQNDFRKSDQYSLEIGKLSAIMTTEVRPRADGLVRIHFKGAFGRVLSFQAEANPAGKKVACRNQRRIPANAASGLAFMKINF
jgi:hypothetical protein